MGADEKIKKINQDIQRQFQRLMENGDCGWRRSNMNLVLLSLIWTECRKGKKGNFAEAVLPPDSTDYSKRAVDEVCRGKWSGTVSMNIKTWKGITETIGIGEEYGTGEKLLLERKEDQLLLYRYCYFLSADERNEEVGPDDLRIWLLENMKACLVYRFITRGMGEYLKKKEQAEKDGEALLFQKEAFCMESRRLNQYRDYLALIPGEEGVNLTGAYDRMSARYEPETDLERALYYIRHMEKGGLEDQKGFYEQNIRLVPDEWFWNMIDEVAGTERPVAVLEEWERALEKQLTLIRAKKYIVESRIGNKRH